MACGSACCLPRVSLTVARAVPGARRSWKEQPMPEYLSPGVYIQEVDSGPRPIEGVGTATAAFVGFAAGGPANTAVLVTNWNQYVSTFGKLEKGRLNPHREGTFLSHSVYGFFLNGGGRC